MSNFYEKDWIRLKCDNDYKKRENRYKLHYKLQRSNNVLPPHSVSETSQYGNILGDSESTGYESDARS